MAWHYEALSDFDLETVARDLLREAWDVPVESFPRGKDGGVDLLVRGPATGPGFALQPREDMVVLVKHYPRATAADVSRAFQRDLTAAGVRRATRIALVTTARLTRAAREKLAGLDPERIGPEHVIGQDGLDALLAAHPQVAQANTKLWLANGDVIDQVLHSVAWHRLAMFMNGLERSRRLLVETPAYGRALRCLEQRGSVILAGAPGVGKTSTARLLAVSMVARDPDMQVSVAVSAIDEAFELVDRPGRRLVVYDDFLGPTLNEASLRKNEAREIRDLLSRAAEDPDLLLILTSRGHVLQQAVRKFEHLADPDVAQSVVTVDLDAFSRSARLHLLRNQLWFSPLQPVLRTRGTRHWSEVVDHPNYNPRHCETAILAIARDHDTAGSTEERRTATGPANRITAPSLTRDSLIGHLRSALNDTERLWRHIVDEQLTDAERDVLFAAATVPRCRAADLLEAGRARAVSAGRAPSRGSEHTAALAALLAGLLRTEAEPVLPDSPIEFGNPGIREVAQRRLNDPAEFQLAADAAVFFEQAERLHQIGSDGSRESGALLAAAVRTLHRPNLVYRDTLPSSAATGPARDGVPLAARLVRLLAISGGPHALPSAPLKATEEIAEGLRHRRLYPGRDDGLLLPVTDAAGLVATLARARPVGAWRGALTRLHHELCELVAERGTVDDLSSLADVASDGTDLGITDQFRERLRDRLDELGRDIVDRSDPITDEIYDLVSEWQQQAAPDPDDVRGAYDTIELEATPLLEEIAEISEVAEAFGLPDPCEDSSLQDAFENATELADQLAPAAKAAPVQRPVMTRPSM